MNNHEAYGIIKSVADGESDISLQEFAQAFLVLFERLHDNCEAKLYMIIDVNKQIEELQLSTLHLP